MANLREGVCMGEGERVYVCLFVCTFYVRAYIVWMYLSTYGIMYPSNILSI